MLTLRRFNHTRLRQAAWKDLMSPMLGGATLESVQSVCAFCVYDRLVAFSQWNIEFRLVASGCHRIPSVSYRTVQPALLYPLLRNIVTMAGEADVYAFRRMEDLTAITSKKAQASGEKLNFQNFSVKRLADTFFISHTLTAMLFSMCNPAVALDNWKTMGRLFQDNPEWRGLNAFEYAHHLILPQLTDTSPAEATQLARLLEGVDVTVDVTATEEPAFFDRRFEASALCRAHQTAHLFLLLREALLNPGLLVLPGTVRHRAEDT